MVGGYLLIPVSSRWDGHTNKLEVIPQIRPRLDKAISTLDADSLVAESKPCRYHHLNLGASLLASES